MIKYLFVTNEKFVKYPEKWMTENNTINTDKTNENDLLKIALDNDIPFGRIYFGNDMAFMKEKIGDVFRLYTSKIQTLEQVPKFASYAVSELVKHKVLNPYSLNLTYSECKILAYLHDLQFRKSKA